MNGINLNLATGWTAATLAAQRISWLKIKRLSHAIEEAAGNGNWESLFKLAEQRDCLISEFFAQEICKPIFHTVVHELAEIKAEHEKTMQQILVQLERNTAKESILKEQKMVVKQSLTQTR